MNESVSEDGVCMYLDYHYSADLLTPDDDEMISQFSEAINSEMDTSTLTVPDVVAAEPSTSKVSTDEL